MFAKHRVELKTLTLTLMLSEEQEPQTDKHEGQNLVCTVAAAQPAVRRVW